MRGAGGARALAVMALMLSDGGGDRKGERTVAAAYGAIKPMKSQAPRKNGWTVANLIGQAEIALVA